MHFLFVIGFLITCLNSLLGEKILRWYAPFLSDSGFGNEATAFIESLSEYPLKNVELQAVQFAEPSQFDHKISSISLLKAFQNKKYHRSSSCLIVICHSTPNFWTPSKDYPSWDYAAPCPNFEAKVKIGRAMFETDSIPSDWVPILNRMDKIWVPTKFAQEIFIRNGVNKQKLEIVTEPVNTEFFNPNNCPIKKDDNIFTFISIFKWELRKGWEQLFEAFLDEFSNRGEDDKIRLLIKTSGFHLPNKETPKSIAEKRFPQIKDKKNIVIEFSQRLTNEQLFESYYCQAHALLAPSYGEGWGRPQAEAASMGIPVIYTNFSGPTEFLSSEYAYPIAIEKMIPVNGLTNHSWALPSVPHLKQIMREVYQNSQQAKDKASVGRRVMIEKYSFKPTANLVWNLIKDYCQKNDGSKPEYNKEEL